MWKLIFRMHRSFLHVEVNLIQAKKVHFHKTCVFDRRFIFTHENRKKDSKGIHKIKDIQSSLSNFCVISRRKGAMYTYRTILKNIRPERRQFFQWHAPRAFVSVKLFHRGINTAREIIKGGTDHAT